MAICGQGKKRRRGGKESKREREGKGKGKKRTPMKCSSFGLINEAQEFTQDMEIPQQYISAEPSPEVLKTGPDTLMAHKSKKVGGPAQ